MATTVTGYVPADAVISVTPNTTAQRRVIYSSPENYTTDFVTAVKAGKQIPLVLVQALDSNLVPTLDITDDIDDGTVTVDTSRMTRRTVQIRVINENGKYTPNDVTDPFYFNNYIRVHRGLRYISSEGIETDEYVCIGTFMVDRVEAFVERGMSVITVDGSDRFKMVGTGGFTTDQVFSKGTQVMNAVTAAMQNALIRLANLRVTGMESKTDSPPAGSELLSNPSFETNLTGWSSPAAPTVDRARVIYGQVYDAAVGDYVLKPNGIINYTTSMWTGSNVNMTRVATPVTSTDGGSWCMQVGSQPGAVMTSVTASFLGGTTYTFSCWVRRIYDTERLMAVVYMGPSNTHWHYDNDVATGGESISPPANSNIVTTTVVADAKPSYDGWTQIVVEWTPKNDQSIVYIYIQGFGWTWMGETGQTWSGYYVDACSLKGGKLGSDRRFRTETRWQLGDSRSDFLNAIYTQFNLEGFFDVYGNYVVREMNDPSEKNSVWTFTPGDDSIMLGITRSQDDLKLVNHVVVTNEASDTVDSGTVVVKDLYITDTTSPVYPGRIGDRLLVYRGQQITSQSQADTVAQRLFRENCVISESIKLPSLVLPILEGNDVFHVSETQSGVDDYYYAQRFEIPLRGSEMTIEAKKVVPVV